MRLLACAVIVWLGYPCTDGFTAPQSFVRQAARMIGIASQGETSVDSEREWLDQAARELSPFVGTPTAVDVLRAAVGDIICTFSLCFCSE